jgi:hypothetical protein
MQVKKSKIIVSIRMLRGKVQETQENNDAKHDQQNKCPSWQIVGVNSCEPI